MTWGAINELTALTAYRRLAKLAGHPVLSELLERIMLDESRHFFFYYRQAEERLLRPGAARVAAPIVDRFWAPVGSGEQGRKETPLPGRLPLRRRRGARRRPQDRRDDPAAARAFESVRLVEAWIDSFRCRRLALRDRPGSSRNRRRTQWRP